ncbi:hypothetical protein O6P43_004664 [Quillaja saponaria]|uniref:Uncharacterized protein n=1 Tax=Quillaja saponaria TaxID=32244 RepID=A0AAD7Q4E5_QUISA|nr:hypothetical protein O6P43_004664 [Quillaja saponaria]
MMNEEANEQIVEEKEVSLDSHPISLGAKIKKGNRDDDLKAVEYPGKITNDTFSIQHEVKTAGENIRKDTTAEHGTIGDDTIKGDPPG